MRVHIIFFHVCILYVCWYYLHITSMYICVGINFSISMCICVYVYMCGYYLQYFLAVGLCAMLRVRCYIVPYNVQFKQMQTLCILYPSVHRPPLVTSQLLNRVCQLTTQNPTKKRASLTRKTLSTRSICRPCLCKC